MKQWTELNPETLAVMSMLGGFSPTSRIEDKELKGWIDGGDYDSDGRTYWGVQELKDISNACLDVIQFLEQRAIS